MRTTGGIALALLALVLLTACGSAKEKGAGESPLIAQCLDRMLEQVDGPRTPIVREYLRRTYCVPFAKHGWVHADGTISIEAHEWMLSQRTCVSEQDGVTTKCDPREGMEAPVLECALLHLVRRSEVQSYLEDLQRRRGKVECDDGTPLDQLGVA
jgi:hypothetical protein